MKRAKKIAINWLLLCDVQGKLFELAWRIDPKQPLAADIWTAGDKGGTRVLRGGSYNNGIDGLTPVARSSQYTKKMSGVNAYDFIGARVCCDADMTGLANK